MPSVFAWRFLRNKPKLGANSVEPIHGRSYYANDWREAGLLGLSGNESFRSALMHGHGLIAGYIRLDGEVRGHPNGRVDAKELTIVCIGDASPAISLFICDEIERLLLEERAQGREPDERSWNALRVKRGWLQGQATDQEWQVAQQEVQLVAKEIFRMQFFASAETQDLSQRAWGWLRETPASEEEQLRVRAWEAETRSIALMQAARMVWMMTEGIVTNKRDVQNRLGRLADIIALPKAIPDESKLATLPFERMLEEEAALYRRLEIPLAKSGAARVEHILSYS